jgi:uncharacterized membrane protein
MKLSIISQYKQDKVSKKFNNIKYQIHVKIFKITFDMYGKNKINTNHYKITKNFYNTVTIDDNKKNNSIFTN